MKLKFTVILLTLALISSALAVGTMSKYAIGGGANDTARVSKWGVTIDINGTNSFVTQTLDGAIVSSNMDKVVAPGTSSNEAKLNGSDTDGGRMTVMLKGTPEVAFALTMGLGTTQDVVLKAGTYTDYTKAVGGNDSRTTFDLAQDYYPVVFTFAHYYKDITGVITYESVIGSTGVEKVDHYATYYTRPAETTGYEVEVFEGTLAELNAFFAAISAKMADVDANYVLDDIYTLEWRWVFNDNDEADTLLGNLAADPNFATDAKVVMEGDPAVATAKDMTSDDYNLTLNYDFTISIVQNDDHIAWS